MAIPYRRFGTTWQLRLQRSIISAFLEFLDSLRWDPIGCPETSLRNYHYSLRNIPEERRVQFYLVPYIRRIDKYSRSSPVGRQFCSQTFLQKTQRVSHAATVAPYQSAYHHITYKTHSILLLVCTTMCGWLAGCDVNRMRIKLETRNFCSSFSKCRDKYNEILDPAMNRTLIYRSSRP